MSGQIVLPVCSSKPSMYRVGTWARCVGWVHVISGAGLVPVIPHRVLYLQVQRRNHKAILTLQIMLALIVSERLPSAIQEESPGSLPTADNLSGWEDPVPDSVVVIVD